MNFSDQEIKKLWLDPKFSASFKGIKTFKAALKTQFDINISTKRIKKIIQTIPTYIIHQKPKKNIIRRSYYVTYYGSVCEMDIAYMYEFNKYKYFIILVDVFSLKFFAEPLKTKGKLEVQQALQKIFLEFGAPIHILQSDQGSGIYKLVLMKELYQYINWKGRVLYIST